MAESTLRVDVPGFDAGQIAREAIAIKLSEALIGSDDAIRKIVISAMETKVSEKGSHSSYSYENKIPYVEWLARDLIQAATKQVLQNRVDAMRPALEALIEKQLAKNAKSIAASLTETFIRNTKAGYGININLTAEFKSRD